MRRIQTSVLKAAPNGKGIRGDGFNYWQLGGVALWVHHAAVSAVRKGKNNVQGC